MLGVERTVCNRPPEQHRVGLAILIAGDRGQPPVVMPSAPDGLDGLMIFEHTPVGQQPAAALDQCGRNEPEPERDHQQLGRFAACELEQLDLECFGHEPGGEVESQQQSAGDECLIALAGGVSQHLGGAAKDSPHDRQKRQVAATPRAAPAARERRRP